jgi:flagellar motor protein MotB
MRIALTRPWIARSLGLALVAVVLGGCVSQQEYDRLVDTNRSLSATTADLQARLDECQNVVGSLRGESGSAGSMITSLQQANEDLRRQLADARAQMEEIENAMGDMAFTRLDPVTDSALRALAERYPGMISYDADRGMLQFASDLTFDSGSAQVKPNAAESLRALANILSSQDAAPYDIRVVGHTDAQRISANTAQRFPTNMHLSVARAIAVRNELAKLNVNESRMEAAGWGEFRPVVANGPGGNTPQNRRVEVYLVKSSRSGTAASPGVGSVEVDTDRGTGGIEPIK